MAKKDITCSLGDKEYLSIDETLVWLGISKDLLYQWQKDGLKFIKKKGRVFFSKELIREFLRHYIV